MDRLLIIDGNSLLNRAFYGVPLLSNSEGIYTNAVYGFCNMLIKAINEHKPKYIAVALDYERKTFRNELYADYKAGRRETPMELGMQFDILKDVLTAMKIKTLQIKGIEADDIIGTLSKRFKVSTIILTGDRDSLQLIDDTTCVWLTKKGISDVKMMDEEELKKDFGVSPSQIIDLKAIMGDKSDNIPGVKGIGEVGAVKLLQQYDTLDGVYENIEAISNATKNKLIESKEMAYLSYKLATIKTDCEIDCNIEDCLYSYPFNNDVKKIFTKYQFSNLLKRTELFEKESVELEQKEVIELINNQQIETALSLIKDKFAFYIDEDIHFCIDGESEFVIKSSGDLLDLLDKSQKIKFLKPYLENGNIVKILFDYKTTRKKLNSYSIQLNNVFDCMIADYVLEPTDKSEDINKFCLKYESAQVSTALYKNYDVFIDRLAKNGLYDYYKKVEFPLSEVLYDMEETGVKVNLEKLKEFEIKYNEEIEELSEKIYEFAGCEFNIKSPTQVAEVLFDKLGIDASKNKKRSTAVEYLQSIENLHPIVPLILRYRKIIKLKSTYVEAYIKYAKNGFIHTEFCQAATATGRLSSKDPNLQNIPTRDDETKLIREVFVSRFDGGKIVSADYNQIELRLLAHFSQDDTLLNGYKAGKDVHAITASKIFKVPLDEVTKEQRRSAKAINFGIIYGQGAFGLSNVINSSVKTAQMFIDAYFNEYPKVKEYLDSCIKNAKETGESITMVGRKRKIPEISSNNFQLRSFGERVAMNTPLQGSASEIIKIAMVNLYVKLKELNVKSKLILQIHDELVLDVAPDELNMMVELVSSVMQDAVELSLELTVGVGVGETLLK